MRIKKRSHDLLLLSISLNTTFLLGIKEKYPFIKKVMYCHLLKFHFQNKMTTPFFYSIHFSVMDLELFSAQLFIRILR